MDNTPKGALSKEEMYKISRFFVTVEVVCVALVLQLVLELQILVLGQYFLLNSTISMKLFSRFFSVHRKSCVCAGNSNTACGSNADSCER